MLIFLIILYVFTMFYYAVYLFVFYVCVFTRGSCKCTMCLAVQSHVPVFM